MRTHPLWRPFNPGANAARQGERVASRQTAPGAVQAHDEGWAEQFKEISRVLTESLGDLALSIRHVGSTSVPGLAAKPVIDVDLTVPGVEGEPSYMRQLEAAGFRLIFRDVMSGDAHRQLTFARPNTNLHVWSPGAIEPQRHLVFADWLRTTPHDRERYNAAKAAASNADGTARHNDLKAAAVYDIYERAFSLIHGTNTTRTRETWPSSSGGFRETPDGQRSCLPKAVPESLCGDHTERGSTAPETIVFGGLAW